jgi:hypothetical protein
MNAISVLWFVGFVALFIFLIWLVYDGTLNNSIALIYTGIGLSVLSLWGGTRVNSIESLFLSFGMQIAFVAIGLLNIIRSKIGVKEFARKSIIPIVGMTFIVLISRLVFVYFKH